MGRGSATPRNSVNRLYLGPGLPVTPCSDHYPRPHWLPPLILGSDPPCQRAPDLQRDTGTSSRFPKDGDVIRVPPKSCNVPLHPGDSHVLISKTKVS